MTGYLTTHVLDTARGCPAEGLKIELFRIDGESRTLLKTLSTNDDGRTDEQILPAAEFATGVYELVFHAGAYLDAIGTPPESPRSTPTSTPHRTAYRTTRVATILSTPRPRRTRFCTRRDARSSRLEPSSVTPSRTRETKICSWRRTWRTSTPRRPRSARSRRARSRMTSRRSPRGAQSRSGRRRRTP